MEIEESYNILKRQDGKEAPHDALQLREQTKETTGASGRRIMSHIRAGP